MSFFDGDTDPRQCRYCAAWEPAFAEYLSSCGICRFHAPTQEASATQRVPLTVWPETQATDGCGQFIDEGPYPKPTVFEKVVHNRLVTEIASISLNMRQKSLETIRHIQDNYPPGTPIPAMIAAAALIPPSFPSSVNPYYFGKAWNLIWAEYTAGKRTFITALAAMDAIGHTALRNEMVAQVRAAQIASAGPSGSVLAKSVGDKIAMQSLSSKLQVQIGGSAAVSTEELLAVKGTTNKTLAAKALPFLKGLAFASGVLGVAAFGYDFLFGTASNKTASPEPDYDGRTMDNLRDAYRLKDLFLQLLGLENRVKPTLACGQCDYWKEILVDGVSSSFGNCSFGAKESASGAVDGVEYGNAPVTGAFDWCRDFKGYANDLRVAINPIISDHGLSCTLPKPAYSLCLTATVSPDDGPFATGTKFAMSYFGYDGVSTRSYWRTDDPVFPAESDDGECWFWVLQTNLGQPKYIFGPYETIPELLLLVPQTPDSSDDSPVTLSVTIANVEYAADFTFAAATGLCPAASVATTCDTYPIPQTLHVSVQEYMGVGSPCVLSGSVNLADFLPWSFEINYDSGTGAWSGQDSKTVGDTTLTLSFCLRCQSEWRFRWGLSIDGPACVPGREPPQICSFANSVDEWGSSYAPGVTYGPFLLTTLNFTMFGVGCGGCFMEFVVTE